LKRSQYVVVKTDSCSRFFFVKTSMHNRLESLTRCGLSSLTNTRIFGNLTYREEITAFFCIGWLYQKLSVCLSVNQTPAQQAGRECRHAAGPPLSDRGCQTGTLMPLRAPQRALNELTLKTVTRSQCFTELLHVRQSRI